MRPRFVLPAVFVALFATPLACSSQPPPQLPRSPPPANPPATPLAPAKPPASAEVPAPVYLWADRPAAPTAAPTRTRLPVQSPPPDWLANITPSDDPSLPGQVVWNVPSPTYPQKPPPASPPPPDEEGWRKVQHTMYRVRRCYKDALAIRPDLGGKVQFKVVAGPDGLVRSATVKSSTLNDSTLENCILALLRELEFAPYDGYPSLVIPMTFMPPVEP